MERTMLSTEQLTIGTIQKELKALSAEMVELIHKYKLDARTSLEIIDVARKKITVQKDYTRFLELSLEGRIYGEAVTALEKELEENTPNP